MLFRLLFFISSFFLLPAFYTCSTADLELYPSTESEVSRLIDYVDTRIGTGGLPWANGNVSPAVNYPFGLVRLGPDAASLGKISSSSGYSWDNTEVQGFSFLRYSGTGLYEGGVLRVTPASKALDLSAFKDHTLLLDHSKETAKPGYYSIQFVAQSIQAEATANIHGGILRFTYGEDTDPHLYLDLTSHLSPSGSVQDLEAQVDLESGVISGHFLLYDEVSSRYGGLPIFFYGRLNTAVDAVAVYRDSGGPVERKTEGILLVNQQDKENILLGIKPIELASQTYELSLALSHVDADGAVRNFFTEINNSFESVRMGAEAAWEQILGRIKVGEEASLDSKTKFYSFLYRSFIMPSQFSDSPLGMSYPYLGYDKQQASMDHPYFADFSLWNTFRTTHPLYNLIAPREASWMIDSLIDVGLKSGRIPRWGGGAGHSDSMLGFPGHIVISEAYQKGVEVPRIEDAYQIMKDNLLTVTSPDKGQECLKSYIELGFCSVEQGPGSVSYTLEYAYADFAMAELARALGKGVDADQFQERSQNVLNHWNEEGLYFEPLSSDGSSVEININDNSYLAVTESGKAYFEGSYNHWRWYMPYNPEALKELYGDRFITELNDFFNNAYPGISQAYPGKYYLHGNEPNIHAAYLFTSGGRPDLAQKWVNQILQNKYAAKPLGLDGDDDAGSLSAWYVLSAIGLYPIAGTTKYYLTAPLFDEIEVNLGHRLLTIKRQNPSGNKNAIYIKSVLLNGKEHDSIYIDHSEISNGDTLEFVMSKEPTQWGVQ